MRFVETPVFTAEITVLLADEEYRRLQLALTLRPAQGRVIRGSGGIRKMRWGTKHRGKRGGIRVIYYWEADEEVCYMLFAYLKTEQEDLTPAQLKILRRVVAEEFG
jgi:mRNA-degrading endonuclease RelE of RelBE toxin-antitoxin system